MEDRRTVLVVDDDRAILELMRDFLEAEGFGVEVAASAGDAFEVIERRPVDCVILDVMMPGESGFEFCRKLRQESELPVLFLSARGEDVDKIRGLGLGGDDYIVKSATPAEVVARVKAVLRRYGRAEEPGRARLDFGNLALDLRSREVFVHGREVQLTPREFDILCLLAQHPRQVFTYDQLLERFWGDVGDRHAVTVHVGRIRQKIEEDPADPRYIVNVWGVGYRFEGRVR